MLFKKKQKTKQNNKNKIKLFKEKAVLLRFFQIYKNIANKFSD